MTGEELCIHLIARCSRLEWVERHEHGLVDLNRVEQSPVDQVRAISAQNATHDGRR
jgi:hypothetical protein